MPSTAKPQAAAELKVARRRGRMRCSSLCASRSRCAASAVCGEDGAPATAEPGEDEAAGLGAEAEAVGAGLAAGEAEAEGAEVAVGDVAEAAPPGLPAGEVAAGALGLHCAGASTQAEAPGAAGADRACMPPLGDGTEHTGETRNRAQAAASGKRGPPRNMQWSCSFPRGSLMSASNRDNSSFSSDFSRQPAMSSLC